MLPASSPLRIAIASAVALSFGPAAAAADVFTAGTVGEVYKGDSLTGGFSQFGGICLGPIRALAFDDEWIYAGDVVGGVVSFDLETGDFGDVFFVPDSVTAMVRHGRHLLISELEGAIRRVDPATGQVIATLSSPEPVAAMALVGDDLYVAGPLGSVHKGSALNGNFEYFGCACGGPMTALVRHGDGLYAGDTGGLVVRYELATGLITGGFLVPFEITALAMDGSVMLVAEKNGDVHRVDPAAGTILSTLPSPIQVEAMIMGPIIDVPCEADLDANGTVGFADLSAFLAKWGACTGCPEDLDGDGTVGFTDLSALLAAWGPCP